MTGALSAMVGGIYSRATYATLNNILNPQKGETNMLKSAFDPDAMLFDGVIGGVIGGLTIPKYIKKSTKTSSIKNTANKNKSNPSCNGTTPKAQSGSTQSLENNLLNNTDEILEGGLETTRETLLETAQNQKLKNAIDQIYRPGATTGDGGLADAIKHQLSTGKLVGGKDHLTKGWERLKNLENIINKQDLNSSDLDLAQKLYNDLKNALGGK